MKVIELNQIVSKQGDEDISLEEMETLLDKFLELIESNGYVCGGSIELKEEEDV